MIVAIFPNIERDYCWLLALFGYRVKRSMLLVSSW